MFYILYVVIIFLTKQITEQTLLQIVQTRVFLAKLYAFYKSSSLVTTSARHTTECSIKHMVVGAYVFEVLECACP